MHEPVVRQDRLTEKMARNDWINVPEVIRQTFLDFLDFQKLSEEKTRQLAEELQLRVIEDEKIRREISRSRKESDDALGQASSTLTSLISKVQSAVTLQASSLQSLSTTTQNEKVSRIEFDRVTNAKCDRNWADEQLSMKSDLEWVKEQLSTKAGKQQVGQALKRKINVQEYELKVQSFADKNKVDQVEADVHEIQRQQHIFRDTFATKGDLEQEELKLTALQVELRDSIGRLQIMNEDGQKSQTSLQQQTLQMMKIMEEKIVSNVSEGIRDGERNWKNLDSAVVKNEDQQKRNVDEIRVKIAEVLSQVLQTKVQAEDIAQILQQMNILRAQEEQQEKKLDNAQKDLENIKKSQIKVIEVQQTNDKVISEYIKTNNERQTV
ncbi:MAG: hypothetical protein EZS28_008594 [Streblomastix strix]|uniref:Uncharacterized protein n=1 Tax=Streblomastix strix TaxID=222440 RepID=A0A5J4WLX3_9EUKA|nr:MAG: hypothetical protein EZS28_008594 [Streblomastix strix]